MRSVRSAFVIIYSWDSRKVLEQTAQVLRAIVEQVCRIGAARQQHARLDRDVRRRSDRRGEDQISDVLYNVIGSVTGRFGGVNVSVGDIVRYRIDAALLRIGRLVITEKSG
jgi:transposase